jgi:uncharacterized protein
MVAFGFGVGVLVGMTGVGGGSLMTPLLILLFGVKPALAIGTDLAYAAVTKTLGGWRHFRSGAVDMAMAGWMALGSIPGALGGVVLLEALDVDEDALILLVGAAVLITGLMTLGRALLLPPRDEVHRVAFTTRAKVKAVVLGFCVGVVLGLTSAGSGALIAVGLIMLFHMRPRQVVGTDVFHAAVLLWAAALAHLVSGNVDFGLMGTLLLGSLPGVWIGSGLADRVPATTLRHVLGGVLVCAGVALVTKAGATLPLAIGAAVVTAALIVVLLRRRPSPA